MSPLVTVNSFCTKVQETNNFDNNEASADNVFIKNETIFLG